MIQNIKKVKYLKKWVKMVNPILPEQEGTNRYDLTDKNGVKIIQSIMKTAESGGGFNEFYFTKSDGKTVAPKVAYSKKLSYEKIKQPPGRIFITWRLVLLFFTFSLRFRRLAQFSVVFKFQIIRLAETVHLCNNTLFSRTLSWCRLIIVNAV